MMSGRRLPWAALLLLSFAAYHVVLTRYLVGHNDGAASSVPALRTIARGMARKALEQLLEEGQAAQVRRGVIADAEAYADNAQDEDADKEEDEERGARVNNQDGQSQHPQQQSAERAASFSCLPSCARGRCGREHESTYGYVLQSATGQPGALRHCVSVCINNNIRPYLRFIAVALGWRDATARRRGRAARVP